MPWWDVDGGRDLIVDHRGRAMMTGLGERVAGGAEEPRKPEADAQQHKPRRAGEGVAAAVVITVVVGFSALMLWNLWVDVWHALSGLWQLGIDLLAGRARLPGGGVWVLEAACFAASCGLAWFARHQHRDRPVLAPTLDGVTRVRDELGASRCPACSYSLAGIEPDRDELLVCPECSAAWSMEAGLTPPGRLAPNIKTPPRYLKLEHERPEVLDALGRPAPFLLQRTVEEAVRLNRRAIVRAMRAWWRWKLLLVPLAAVCLMIAAWSFGSSAGLPWQSAMRWPVMLCIVWLVWNVGSAVREGVRRVAADTARDGMCPCCCDPFVPRGEAITKCATCGGWWLAPRQERPA